MKILIVDDSNIIRRSIQRAMGDEKFAEVQTAGNGSAAVEIFRDFLPDVVTMDITMPEMDGLTCVEALLKIKSDVRILVISALGDKATAVEAIKRGAEGFLLKPFTADELQEALDEILED